MQDVVIRSLAVSRRSYVRLAGLGLVGALAACAPSTPAPTAAPAKPTAAPAKPTAAPAQPTAAPKAAAPTPAAKAAPTAAPKAAPTFAPASARLLTTSGATQGVGRTLVDKQGYYKQFNLTVDRQEIVDGNRLLSAIVAGEAELGDGGIGGIFPAVQAGADIKIIGSYNTLTPFVIYTKPEIKTFKDLEGKSVGTGAQGALLHILMIAALKKSGVDPNSVQFVNIGGSPAVFQAVAAGKVDAGPSQISYLTTAKEQNIGVLAELGQMLPEFVNTGFFAHNKIIAEKRDILVRMLAAYAKMYDFVKSPESKQTWIDVGVDTYKLKPEDAQADWEWIRKNNAFAWDFAFTPAQMAFMQQVNIDGGLQQGTVPYEKLVDMSIAQDALKLARG